MPVVSRFARDVYGRLAPAHEAMGGDESRGWHALHFVAALSAMFRRVEQLVQADDGSPPWRNAVDVETAATEDLPFVGQLIGSRPLAGQSDPEARARIRNVDGFKRGRPSAIVDSVKPSLTGTQYVGVVEMAGGAAYQLQISTRSSETPSPATSLARAIAAKPAGLVLTFTVTATVTWGELETRNPATTWSGVEAQFATYADAEAVV